MQPLGPHQPPASVVLAAGRCVVHGGATFIPVFPLNTVLNGLWVSTQKLKIISPPTPIALFSET